MAIEEFDNQQISDVKRNSIHGGIDAEQTRHFQTHIFAARRFNKTPCSLVSAPVRTSCQRSARPPAITKRHYRKDTTAFLMLDYNRSDVEMRLAMMGCSGILLLLPSTVRQFHSELLDLLACPSAVISLAVTSV